MTMTPTTAEQMPDLPEAALQEQREFLSRDYDHYYTAEQMRAYGQACRATAQGGARGEPVAWQYRVAMPTQEWQVWRECSKRDFDEFAHNTEGRRIEYRALCVADAALAPRAEAGEAVDDPAYMAGRVVNIAPDANTAACGVSGLVGKWRSEDEVSNTYADELEASLKANRGGAYAYQRPNALPRSEQSPPPKVTAALNAGALAGGELNAELLDDAIQVLAEGSYALGHHETLRSSDDDTIAYWTKYTEEAKQRLRSLVVGGVG